MRFLKCTVGILLCGILLSGCMLPAQTKSTQSSQEFSVLNEDDIPLVQVRSQLPDGQALVSGQAGETIAEYYAQVAAESKNYWNNELADFAQDDLAAAQDATQFRPYTVEETYAVMYENAQLLSILRTNTSYTGGLHENQEIFCETFRKSDGSRMMLSDFLFSDYREKILAELTSLLEEKRKNGIPYYDDAEKFLYTALDNECFYVTDQALVMVYPCYVLAPYSAGVQSFEIPLQALEDVLRKE